MKAIRRRASVFVAAIRRRSPILLAVLGVCGIVAAILSTASAIWATFGWRLGLPAVSAGVALLGVQGLRAVREGTSKEASKG